MELISSVSVKKIPSEFIWNFFRIPENPYKIPEPENPNRTLPYS